MEVFEERARVSRQTSSASTQLRRNSKVRYILTMAGIVLFTMALLVVIHFSREYSFWSNENLKRKEKISVPEKLERRTCDVPFCNTKECVFIASGMLDAMNSDADPCADFHNYACGGYPKENAVPYASDYYSPTKEAQQELLIDIRKSLEKPPSAAEGSAMTKVRKFYDACMNTSRRNEVENRTLSFWLSDLKLVPENYAFGDPFDFEPLVLWTEVVSRLEQYQIHTLFKPHFVSEGTTAPETLEVDCLLPSLSPEAYFNTTDDELAFQLVMYKESMNAALDLLHMDRATRKEFIADVMKIDMDVARSIREPVPYSPLTDDQKQLLRNIWKPIVGNPIENMNVVSTCKYDMHAILTILSDAPNQRVTRYVMWRMMMQMMQYMGTDFRDLHIHYMTKLPSVDYAFESKWKECIDIVRTDLSLVAMRSLVDNGYLKNETIEAVHAEFKEMKRDLALVFNYLVANLDPAFAKGTMDKLKSMKLTTGFVENITDNTVLDSVYNALDIVEDHFSNMLAIKRFKARRKFLRLRNQNTDTLKEISLDDSPLGINANYNYVKNTVHVDLGLLRPPVFVHSDQVPEYLTYAFSSILARELSHAFDTIGSHYNSEGEYLETPSWPAVYKEKYESFSACLKHLAVSSNADSYVNVNDTRVINNMMADMTSFFIPYEGLKAHLKKHINEKPLPGVPLNKKQTFFVQAAQLLCEVRSKPSSDPNSRFLLSPKHRVNIAISNMEEFASIFNCPVGSVMNKGNICDDFNELRNNN